MMTNEEKALLREWTDAGNGERDNPWLMAGEDGRPLGFVTALRGMLPLEAGHRRAL